MASPIKLSSPSPSTIMTLAPPIMTMLGGGSTIYGSESTESPSLANFISYSLQLFTRCGLWTLGPVANYI